MENIISIWPTNFIFEQKASEATPEFLKEIIAIGEEYEAMHPEAHVPVAMRKSNIETTYNLLSDERPAAQIFKKMIKDRMTSLAIVEGFYNPDKVVFEGSTSLRKFAPGEYAKPHNHRSVDYVAVLWVDLEVTDHANNPTHQKLAGNRLHMIDPIAARSRLLNHKMCWPVSPVPGTFVIHPASVYHTSEMNIGNKDTIALVTNIKVAETVRNYVKL